MSAGTTAGRTQVGRTQAVLALLDEHDPAEPAEKSALERIRVELERLEHPFDESADPVHVTASAVVVGSRGTLLHLHKRLGLWLQPGGHIETTESPDCAAIREAREETGIDVVHIAGGPDLIHVDVHEAARGHTHLDLRYLASAPDVDPRPPGDESQAVRWFSWEEAFCVADDSLAAALKAAQREIA